MTSGLLIVIALLIIGIGLTTYYWIQERRKNSKLLNRISKNELRETFARAIFQSAANEESLANILRNYFPKMFPGFDIHFWIFLERSVWKNDADDESNLASISAWMLGKEGIEIFQAGDAIPWDEGEAFSSSTIFAALQPEGNQTPIAGLRLSLSDGSNEDFPAQQLIDTDRLLRYSVDYISNFLAILQKANQDIELQQVQQEIAIASQIQSDLLPIDIPKMPGWQLSFSLQSAGDLSGDFFDLIQISESQIGILVADVAGKGLGAALYMALCRTLIRTFAKEYASRPDLVISECNERLLEDARDALFVTAFYGVLDIKKKSLTYANAGHNPPFMIGHDADARAQALPLTGLPIGIDQDEEWTHEQITFAQGDILMIYSDGIPDAHNEDKENFGDMRLLDFLQAHRQLPASQFQDELLEGIKQFCGASQQFDDMTLLILKHELD